MNQPVIITNCINIIEESIGDISELLIPSQYGYINFQEYYEEEEPVISKKEAMLYCLLMRDIDDFYVNDDCKTVFKIVKETIGDIKVQPYYSNSVYNFDYNSTSQILEISIDTDISFFVEVVYYSDSYNYEQVYAMIRKEPSGVKTISVFE